jgi:phosphoglycolate phosphatase
VPVENLFSGLRAALFDLDGTLIETHIDFVLMKQETLCHARECGIGTEGLQHLDILSIVEAGRDYLARTSGVESASDFRQRAFSLLEEIEVSHCANPVEIPGAAQILCDLEERGVRIGIVTRNCRTVANRLVEFAGLRHGALLTRDDVPRTKPDPAHLWSAIELLGLKPVNTEAASQFLMTGDHWMDVHAGRSACMRTVGILRGKSGESFAPAMPDLLVNELADLLPIVKAA